MKWLVDAQLPKRVADRLNELGHDAVHTLALPEGNRTKDAQIIQFATESGRIIVTKDRDFIDSHLLSGEPSRLLWVTTGNITNQRLLVILEYMLPDLERAFEQSNCVELTLTGLGIH